MSERTERTTAEWRRLAQIDPLYVIHTLPGKQGSWERDEFYATGRSDWEDFRRHWLHYEPRLAGACVEIGCGAGRVTHSLAADFERVVALDVSAHMLALARDVVPANVELVQVSGAEIPLPDGSVQAVFTCHVLQHLEGLDVVSAYLGEARRVLRPGGTLMVQLGLHSTPMRLHGRLRQEVRLWAARRARARGRSDLTFRVRLYRREEIDALLKGLGFVDIELRVFATRSSGAQHAFWLARASAVASLDA